MNSRYQIMFSISFALAIFYSLPWVALSEHARMAGMLTSAVGVRVIYLFITVFVTSILFFQYNLFLKSKLWIKQGSALTLFLNIFFNILMVIAASVIIMIISNRFLNIPTGRGYFIFYLFRNAGIDLVVVLVTYVVELVAKSRGDKIKVLTLQSQNSEAELAALRSQIDPHFLFNSLTSLSGLIRAHSKEALAFVNHLTETFRYILEKRDHRLVTAEEELHFLQSYIFMMQKRFVDGFQVLINIDSSVHNRNIPQFALQIALENAMKHNIVSAKNQLIIEIFDMGNSIVVRNNLQKKKIISGYGIGLENLSRRYRILGSRNIEVKKSESHFEIVLPLL